MADRATKPIGVELPRMLSKRGLSLRALAEDAGVSVAHLSKGLRGDRGKTITGELAGRLAVALDLPEDYFLEYRQAVVVAAVTENAKLCDEVFDGLPRRRRRLR